MMMKVSPRESWHTETTAPRCMKHSIVACFNAALDAADAAHRTSVPKVSDSDSESDERRKQFTALAAVNDAFRDYHCFATLPDKLHAVLLWAEKADEGALSRVCVCPSCEAHCADQALPPPRSHM